jgi:hypothetical protein
MVYRFLLSVYWANGSRRKKQVRKPEKKSALCLFFIFSIFLLLPSLFMSCYYFFGSYFPSYLSQIVQVADFNARLDADAYDNFDVFVMNNNAVRPDLNDEYIFLICRPRDGQGIIYVLDTELKEVKKHILPTGDSIYNLDEFHMVSATGEFRISGYTISTDGQNISAPVHRDSQYGLACDGMDWEMNTSPQSIYPEFPSRLYYGNVSEFNSTDPLNYIIDDNLSNPYELQNVAVDTLPGDVTRVMLAFCREDDDRGRPAYIFLLPQFPLAVSPVTSLINNPGIKTIIKPDMDTNHTGVYYTRQGLVVSHGMGIRKLYNFSGEELAVSIDIDTELLREDYDLNGDFYYVFNIKEKQLYKCHTWWNK